MDEPVSSPPAGPVVKLFRQVLIWPLLLKTPPGEECREGDLGEWKRVGQSMADLRAERGPLYDEIVYFHPFVRDFLYGDAKYPPAMKVYRRSTLGGRDIKSVRLRISRRDEPLQLMVRRLELYVFDTDIVLFVLEIDNFDPADPSRAEELSLFDAQNALDEFRRAYPPFWEGTACWRVPQEVAWLGPGGASDVLWSGQPVGPAAKQKAEAFTAIGAEPPMSEHWKVLLEPLVPYPGGPMSGPRWAVQQIEDERIPSMCYLAFDDPRALKLGDFVRLTFHDDSGGSETVPYSRGWLRDFDERYALDLFWNQQPPEGEQWHSTRYLCCGYGFVAIGRDDRDSWPYFTKPVVRHFRHHYFKLGLIAHFQKASLLSFSDRLSEAVKGERVNVGELRRIREDFLRFRSRFWFTEVSNQVQGKELFDLWSKHLNTKRLFNQIREEAETAFDYIDGREQKERTEESVRLTVVATVGLAASIYFAILGWVGWGTDYRLALVGSLVVVVTLLVIALSDRLGRMFRCLARWGNRLGSPDPDCSRINDLPELAPDSPRRDQTHE